MSEPDLARVLAEERQIMDDYAPDYDAAMLSNGYVYDFVRRGFVCWLTECVGQAGRSPAELAVLEAGCGTGSTLELLAAAGFEELLGLDLSPRMLEVARQRAIPGTRLIHAPIESAALEPHSVDVIVGVLFVHHLKDPAAFFRIADDLLRPGGFIFLLEYERSGVPPADACASYARRLADAIRSGWAWKNRRALAARPRLEPRFNPAHRLLSWPEIHASLPDATGYELRREVRGRLLAALLPVLVSESRIDRMAARCADAVDRHVLGARRGLFQWIEARRGVDTRRPAA